MKFASLAALTTSLFLAASAPLLAQTSPGYTLLEKGWVKDAIAAFQNTLSSNPNDLSARLGLAQAFQKAGNIDQAWSNYQKVITQDPKNTEALMAIGILGEYRSIWQKDGITALTQLLTLQPNNRNAIAQRATLLGYQGEFGRSLSEFDRVLKDQSTPPTAAMLIGAAKINTYADRYEQALTLFEQAKKLQPLDDYSLAAYTTALTKTGQTQTASTLLETRLMMKDVNAEAEFELRKSWAIALAQQNDIDRAAKILRQHNTPAFVGQVRPSIAQGLSEVARISDRADLYREAISLYRQLLSPTANAPAPSPTLAIEAADVMSEQAGTRAEALALYDRAAQQLPADHPVAIKREVLAYRLTQRSTDQLRDFLTRQINRSKANPTQAQATQTSIAMALLPIDPPDAALLSLYETIASPQQPFLYYRLAQIHAQNNQFDKARTSLAQYQSTPAGQKDIAPDLLLATIAQKSGNFDEGIATFEHIIRQSQKPAQQKSALRGLANLYREQSQWREALTTYDRILKLDPQDAGAQFGRSHMAMLTRTLRVADAAQQIETWLDTNPGATPPAELLALAEALPLDPSRASLYQRLLALSPNQLQLQRRSLQLLAQTDPAQTRSKLAELMKTANGDINAYYLKGEVARSLQDLDLAAQAYQSILSQQPENVDALSALAGVRFEQKRYPEAGNIYNQAIALRPNDWLLRRTLADLSLAQDQPFLALNHLKIAQSLQRQQNVLDDRTEAQIVELEVDGLKRRSFQPKWEGYSPLE